MFRFAALAVALVLLASPAAAGFCRDRALEAQRAGLEVRRLSQRQHNSQQEMMRLRTRISRLRSREIRYNCGIDPKPGYGAECHLISREIVDLRAEILQERSRRDLRGVRIRDLDARFAGLAVPFRQGGQCLHAADAPEAVRCGPDGTGVVVGEAHAVRTPSSVVIENPADPLHCVLACYAREDCRIVDHVAEGNVCILSPAPDDPAEGEPPEADAFPVIRYRLCG